MELLLALLTLLAGLAIGWFAATSRGMAQLAATRAQLAAERSAAAQREAMLTHTDAQLRETFGSLAGEALSRNTETVLALAESRLAGARAAADGSIEALVAPLRESLQRVQAQLGEVERDRAGSYAQLLEQVATMRQTSEQLRTETAALVTALRAPQVRGRWGELHLERAVEAAGLTEHVDYVTQASTTTDDGTTVRPDLVVHLVGGKKVVVDSKVAFSGYLEAMEARDEATRANRLRAHARQLREHVDSLAAKAYWQQFTPSPEFVVCFVPADAFLDAALREDPALLEHAFARNVVLATPTTLVTLLRTVAYTWRQDALAENAAQVHRLGRELYQRLATMGGHLDRLGRSLGGAVTAYNSAVSSLETRVFVTARRLADLDAVDPSASLDPPRQLTTVPRSPQAAEFTRTEWDESVETRVIGFGRGVDKGSERGFPHDVDGDAGHPPEAAQA